MKWTTLILGAAAGGAALALLAWAFAPRPLEVETATATTGRFEATIDEDGRTRLRERYVVSAPLAGTLARIALREGDAVEAGDVVATLTPVLPSLLDERTLRDQQLRVRIAQAQAQRARARIDAARVALAQAGNEARRSEQLSAQSFVSPAKLETDRLTALAAQKDLETAVEDGHVADREVEQAQAALLAVQAPVRAGRAFLLHAPVAGRVLRVAQASEATVPLGAPLIELGDVARLEVVAELRTTDALRARAGSRVLIERWGGDCTLDGRVRLVEPGAYTKVSALGVEEQRVNVLIDIVSPPDLWRALGDAYRVSVRIVTTSAEQALQVPAGALFPRADAPGMAVYLVDGGRARWRPVDVAARNGEAAWIRSGLEAGQTVVVYPPATLADGARVKARRT